LLRKRCYWDLELLYNSFHQLDGTFCEAGTTDDSCETDEDEEGDADEFEKAEYDREQEGLEGDKNPDWAEGGPH
jgi:hypothetical protein